MDEEKAVLARRALHQAREYGHAIPRITWDGEEGIGTCTRCGDGVLLYVGGEGSSMSGTAVVSACPGNTCDHGWAVRRTSEGRVVLRCLHCGAIRTEG